MARHNRPNNNSNQSNHSHNNSNSKSGESTKAPGAPSKSTAPGVAFTPSHSGARASDKSGRIDLSKGQNEFKNKGLPRRGEPVQSDGRGAKSPISKREEDTIFGEERPDVKSARLSENEPPANAEFPQKPLPDLRYGIPSTLEFEATSSPLNLTESKDPHSTGGRGKGELPASAYISSSDRKRARFANIMYAMFAGAVVSGVLYLGRNWDDADEEGRHPDAPSGWAIGLMWSRAKARLGDQIHYYTEPAFQKLLPLQDPAFERPYTLVLSLEDMLLHSEWTREHGWRMAKRPGVDYFLRYLSNYFEIVIFTSQPSQMAEPVIRKLDPFRIAQWSLYREATYYENGEYIKV
jgi:import inner membrane translocase subunit TIM50